MGYDSYATAGYCQDNDIPKIVWVDSDGNENLLVGNIPGWSNNELFYFTGNLVSGNTRTYNVYRDGELLITGVDQTSYIDSDLNDNDQWDSNEEVSVLAGLPRQKVILKNADWFYKVSPRIGFSHVITDKSTFTFNYGCLLYTSPSPRDVEESRMPSSA